MLRSISVAILVVFLLDASEPPTPSGGNTQTEQKTNADNHHGDRQNTQCCTAASPFIVQIQPKEHDDVAPERKRDGHWYTLPDWWVAGFTGALFVATTGLWIFTALMWRATRQTAQSFIHAEFPYIYPGEPNTTLFLPTGAKAVYPTSPNVPHPRITCTFVNVGRTPAVIKAIRGEISVGGQLPNKPHFTYSEERRGDVIARPDKETEPIPFDFNRNLTVDEITNIGGGTPLISFFGYVKYTDVFDHLVTKAFCFRLRLGTRALAEVVGGEPYNYRRYEKTPPEFVS
jgi:hypothetical protein